MKYAGEYPKYIIRYDYNGAYIGAFQREEYGIPIYRFPGGDSIADNNEIRNGSDERISMEKLQKEYEDNNCSFIPDCFLPEKDTLYPLCVGNGSEKCVRCYCLAD